MKIRILYILIFLVIIGCSKDDEVIDVNTPPLGENTISGKVELPEESSIDVNTLQIFSPVDVVNIFSGNYQMNTLPDKFITQLVSTSNGEVILMGYTYPGQEDFTINAKSTALAMLMNFPTSLMLADEGKKELLDVFLSHPDFANIVKEVEAILLKNQSPIAIKKPELSELIVSFYSSVVSIESKFLRTKDYEVFEPLEIRLVNNKITFVNPGKSYETVVGVYKDNQRIKKIEVNRVNFFPTSIGELLSAGNAALGGEVPSNLQPAEYEYEMVGDGTFEIKVNNGGDFCDENDIECEEATFNNLFNWCQDIIIEIMPIGDCLLPTLGNLKKFLQSLDTLPNATTQQEKLGLVFDVLNAFFDETTLLVECYVDVEEYEGYFKRLKEFTKWLDFIGKAGNALNLWVGVMQLSNDASSMEECYLVEGNAVDKCEEDFDVYVLGVEYVSIPGYLILGIIKVWKDGEEVISIQNGNELHPKALAVSGDDIYILGREHDNNKNESRILIWKNDVLFVVLSDWKWGATFPVDLKIFNDNIYAVFNDHTIESEKRSIKLWTNGITTNVSNNEYAAYATGMFIYDGDVYVSGNGTNNLNEFSVSKIWKNGVATNLSDGSTSSSSNDVFVLDGNVYTFIQEYRNGNLSYIIIKDGLEVDVIVANYQTSINKMFVENNDVYMVGQELIGSNITVPKFWKNGVPTELSSGSVQAGTSGIEVVNDDVYISGHEVGSEGFLVAKLWKNGIITNLSDGQNRTETFDIFIKNNN